MSRNGRAEVLERIADLVAENKEKLAALETEDTGKPLSVSRNVDVSRVEENFRYFAAKLRVQENSCSSLKPGRLL
ncbi:aldehyde dehydrogenase, putative, partial [Perkinsus marinus ATCC 50983]